MSEAEARDLRAKKGVGGTARKVVEGLGHSLNQLGVVAFGRERKSKDVPHVKRQGLALGDAHTVYEGPVCAGVRNQEAVLVAGDAAVVAADLDPVGG